MTTKPKARKFRIRRGAVETGQVNPDDLPPPDLAEAVANEEPAPQGTAPASKNSALPPTTAEAEIETIKAEGLTGRQLRMARRVAQKHNLSASSDLDAVRLLRQKGIDPFKRSNMLELVVPQNTAQPARGSSSWCCWFQPAPQAMWR